MSAGTEFQDAGPATENAVYWAWRRSVELDVKMCP